MGGPRSTVPKSDIIAAFLTDVPFKAYAAEIGMSPNTLRGLWKEAYGEEAFILRGKKIQAASAVLQAKAMSVDRTYKDVAVRCCQCQADATLKANQAAQIDPATFLCEQCRGDRNCPVCNLRVNGERGLSGHFRHRREAGDESHLAYQADQVLIKAKATTINRSEAAKNRHGGHGKGGTKTVTCPGCGIKQDKSKFLVVGVHDFRCIACKQKAEDARWVDKHEGEDYVRCLECGYRAENLTSHVQNAHPGYRASHPDAQMVALMSAVRDKTAIRGVVRSPEFGQKIREAKLLGFTLEDFIPFLEPDGTVDHRKMLAAVGCALPTLQRYMADLGLAMTKKYVEAAGVDRRVNLTAEQLHQYKLGNGKVSIAKAVLGLKVCNITIKKECRRLALPWARGNVLQHKCLAAVSEVLGGVAYQEEWRTMRFCNPLTGHQFRFDGYFHDIGLVIEVQGYQHYTFPNWYIPHESYRPLWEAMVERDRIKREMITNAPDLTYLEVLEDEPYMDATYLTGRLVQAGVLEVRAGGIWLGDKLVRPVSSFIDEP